jgi:hypothetical protein
MFTIVVEQHSKSEEKFHKLPETLLSKNKDISSEFPFVPIV